jgi:hypothetical protein
VGVQKTAATFNWGPQPVPPPPPPPPPPWATSTSQSGTSAPLSCSGDDLQQVWVEIVQTGGTATTAASFVIQASPDGATFYSGQPVLAPLASGANGWVLDVPPTAQAVQIVFSAAAGPAGLVSTISAQLGGESHP